MSRNPNNQPPVGGAVNPNLASTNVGQVTTPGDDASTTPPFVPSAPNRARLNTATAVPHPNNQTQQGTVKTQNDKPVYAGTDPAQIAFYRWW